MVFAFDKFYFTLMKLHSAWVKPPLDLVCVTLTLLLYSLLIKCVQILTRRNKLQPRYEHRAKHLTQQMHTQCPKSYSPSPFIGEHKYWWGRGLPCQTNDALWHRPVRWRAPLGLDQSESGSRRESEPVIVLLETTALRQRAKQQQLLVKHSNKTCFWYQFMNPQPPCRSYFRKPACLSYT